MKKYNICVIPAYPLENVQLLKDRIMIPYVCYKHFGESMTIVTQQIEEYPYLDYLDGVCLYILPCSETFTHMQAAVQYVENNYEQIDLLFLFGFRLEYARLAAAYKRLNPDGIIYLKLDANSGWVNALPSADEDCAYLFNSCDIISCEARRLQQFIYKKWRRPIEYISNGIFYPFYPSWRDISYQDKENIILTVGRLGSVQKNSHVLLYAYALAFLNFTEKWELVMIGSVTPEFREIYQVFCREFPEIAPYVHLTGNISDKSLLHQYYRRAKIFALTSYMEGGCPNVFAEAGSFGCTILTTNVDAALDMTDNGRLGTIVDNPEDIQAYSKALSDLCANQDYLRRNFDEMRKYIREFFDYDLIAERLHILIELAAIGKSDKEDKA